MSFTLDGDVDHRDWDFETALVLTLRADDGPARAGTNTRGAPGTEVDFFGRKRGGDRILAGPFQDIAGTASTLTLWPPPTATDGEGQLDDDGL